MASTVATQTRDFARCFFQVVQEDARDDWVSANVAFERTIARHPDHPYVAYLQANRAGKAGFAAAAERVREREFPQIERRKAGTRRNAPVFYRVGRADAGFSLELPYAVPASHPLRTAAEQAKGNPLRRKPEAREARSPWRRRQGRRRTRAAASPENAPSATWWQKLAHRAAALLDLISRPAPRQQRSRQIGQPASAPSAEPGPR